MVDCDVVWYVVWYDLPKVIYLERVYIDSVR